MCRPGPCKNTGVLSMFHTPHLAHLSWSVCNTTALTTMFIYVEWKIFHGKILLENVPPHITGTCKELRILEDGASSHWYHFFALVKLQEGMIKH